jgi:hypothetical protein
MRIRRRWPPAPSARRPAPASAPGEPPTSTSTPRSARALEQGKEVDAARRPSLILPATNELVWGSSPSSGVFLLGRSAYPAIKEVDGRAVEQDPGEPRRRGADPH